MATTTTINNTNTTTNSKKQQQRERHHNHATSSYTKNRVVVAKSTTCYANHQLTHQSCNSSMSIVFTALSYAGSYSIPAQQYKSVQEFL